MKYLKYYLLSLGIIAIDQVVKLVVHESMIQGPAGQIPIFGDWFKLYYILNPGMAFGAIIPGLYGKLILTLFRIVAMGAIAGYLYVLAKKQMPALFLWSIALILGGAIGNVVDSTFYGVFLNNAPIDAPTPWFHGQVIDMFYFDLWEGQLPGWIPLFGGEWYSFWPIFNIADASIFVGVCLILLFQKRIFHKEDGIENKDSNSVTPIENQNKEVV